MSLPDHPQLAPGTSFQAAGRSPTGSQTTSRVSQDTHRRDLPSGMHLPEQADVAGEQQRRAGGAGMAVNVALPAGTGDAGWLRAFDAVVRADSRTYSAGRLCELGAHQADRVNHAP